MKLAFIAPINHIELAERGDVVLLLPQFANNEKYVEFAKKTKKYKILDNGACEKEQSSEERLLQLAKEWNVDEIVAPDKLYQAEFTEFATECFIGTMSDTEKNKYKIMAVPQADNLYDYVRCYKSFLNNPQINVIGLSKLSVPASFSSITHSSDVAINRKWLVTFLHKKYLLKKTIHLLGLHYANELTEYAKYDKIRSCDSNLVFTEALNNVDISKSLRNKKVIERYFDSILDTSQQQLALKNIDYMKSLMNDNFHKT